MLLQGLQFLHVNEVLHLDVKPDNIYRDSEGVLKLGDFGLAVLRHQWVSISMPSCPVCDDISKRTCCSLHVLCNAVEDAVGCTPNPAPLVKLGW